MKDFEEIIFCRKVGGNKDKFVNNYFLRTFKKILETLGDLKEEQTLRKFKEYFLFLGDTSKVLRRSVVLHMW